MNSSLILRSIILLGLCVSLASADPTAQKQVLTLEGARKVIAAAVAEAKKAPNPTGVIAVVDDGGNVIAVERLDGTFAAGSLISIGKARTAALFKKPTRVFEKIIRDGRTPMVALNDFTPLQGGVPIEIDGYIVGAIGVSGAASAQADDDIAVAGANAFASGSPASLSDRRPVSFFDSRSVADSFAQGGALVGGNGTTYAVHTSRRTAPGTVEIHSDETDIIYVVQGSATFLTGGQIENGRQTAPGEIRAERVTGAETRQLGKGDVVIVPPGTPHWFRQVDGEFLYYVVKVKN
jgi:glc operon protein GlcG